MTDGNRELVIVMAALALLVFALYAGASMAAAQPATAINDPMWGDAMLQTNPGFTDPPYPWLSP